MTTKFCGFRVDAHLLDKLTRHAEAKGVTVSEAIRIAITRYLAEAEPAEGYAHRKHLLEALEQIKVVILR